VVVDAVATDRGRTVVAVVAVLAPDLDECVVSVVGAPVVAVRPLHALTTTMTIPATSTLVLRLRTVDTLGTGMRKITMGKFATKANNDFFVRIFSTSLLRKGRTEARIDRRRQIPCENPGGR
jgi:hypothetical protein